MGHTEDTCSNCKFSWGVHITGYTDSEEMYCRRYPKPQLKDPDRWCGEHKPKLDPMLDKCIEAGKRLDDEDVPKKGRINANENDPHKDGSGLQPDGAESQRELRENRHQGKAARPKNRGYKA